MDLELLSGKRTGKNSWQFVHQMKANDILCGITGRVENPIL